MQISDGIRAVSTYAVARILAASLRRALPATPEEWRNLKISYSQFGEDILIETILGHYQIQPQFFVDIGAYDPIQFSNTLRLVHRGCRGINIDANPKQIEKFRRLRPRDINIWSAVSNHDGEESLLFFDEAPTNRLEACAKENKSILGQGAVSKILVPVRRMSEILRQHMPTDVEFTVLNVDVEGAEMQVLEGNDWDRFRPRIVVVEDHSARRGSEIERFCVDKGYEFSCQAFITKIFVSVK